MIIPTYKNIYDKFIEHYKNVHVNPWHEINEKQLEKIYIQLINSMEIKDEYSFKYFMDYIIKRLSGKTDAHTMYDLVSLLPLNFRVFNEEVLVNYPENLKNSKLIAINEVPINKIMEELEEVITYGTDGKRKYELEKSLFNKFILFGLPSLRNCNNLIFKLENLNGKIIKKEFLKDKEYTEELFDYDKYRYGNNAIYRFIDNCLIYNHSSVQIKFKERIEKAIENLKKENLDSIKTIIIDIRGNIGGNSSLNKLLINFLLEHNDKTLICLTDYRVFSAGRYALRDLVDLGAITIGEEISTPINCYGNSNWINIDNHFFSVSECYFHPILSWNPATKTEFQKEVTGELLKPYIFKPDILVEMKKEDFIKGRDTILNYALKYSETKS